MKRIEFLEKARSKHGYKYEYLDLGEKIISNDIIKISFNGNLYTQRVSKHLMGRCPEKNTPIKTIEEFIQESEKIWGKKYDYSLVKYQGALKKVKIIFDGIIFEQTPSSHLQGLCVERNLTVENFIRKSIEVHGEKYDYSQIDKMDKKVKIGLNGVFYKQNPYDHISGYKPENIKLSVKKTIEDFISESNIIHYNKYSYTKTIYENSKEKVIITCPNHGDFLKTPLQHLQGNGCPDCIESIGLKKISKYLSKNNINFEIKKKFHDCRNIFELPFDFYIPSLRTCIDFDGIQHFQPIEHFGGLEAYEKLKINDGIKNEYCEEHFINLIRIKYDQVNKIFDILSRLILYIKEKG